EPILRRNRRFTANEPLDSTDRDNYHNLIQKIWSGVVRSSPSQINNQCVNIVNTILDTVMECSKRMALTQHLYEELYAIAFFRPPNISKVIYKIVKEFILAWMEASRNENVYQACLNTAKLQWRSPIELALLGL
ncbi:unnamed protein product, partial [Rotaria sordida]